MIKLKLVCVLTAGLLLVSIPVNTAALRRLLVHSLQLSTYPGYYLAPYRINGERPECFENVAYFRLGEERHPKQIGYDEDGNALVNGVLHMTKGTNYKFRTAKLRRSTTLFREGRGLFDKLIFTTETIASISYSFEGQFLFTPEESKPGVFTHLKGVLIKYKDGQKVAEARLGFTMLRKE